MNRDKCAWPVDAIIIGDVQEAAVHALAKHGQPTSNLNRACNILAEELGEVTQCALKLTSTNPYEITQDGRYPGIVAGKAHWTQSMRHELCQLAAYAMLQIQRIDEESDRA